MPNKLFWLWAIKFPAVVGNELNVKHSNIINTRNQLRGWGGWALSRQYLQEIMAKAIALRTKRHWLWGDRNCRIATVAWRNLGTQSNRCIESDLTAHAEMVVLREAAKRLNQMTDVKKAEVTLYTTLEPCLLCTAAISFVGIKRVVYSALKELLLTRLTTC